MTALALSYVWHHESGKCFKVSTINRYSSALHAQGAEYAETFVWECDPKTLLSGAFVGQAEGSKNSLHTHQSVMDCLAAWGTVETPD